MEKQHYLSTDSCIHWFFVSMAPPSSQKFIDTALSCTTAPFALSYTDPNQKWLIQKHLLSLLQDFPTLSPSTDTFNHDDGTTVNLLNASGYLHLKGQSTPPILLTIWVHENYPYMAPIVFITSNSTYPIRLDHPFVDPTSGAITCPYLQTWPYPGCNLSDLVHNLVILFLHDHPLFSSPVLSGSTRRSLVSKREAIDRLVGNLHYDMMALQGKTEEEIEELSIVQIEMINRADITKSMIIGLEHEKMKLKNRVVELGEEADVLINWLRVHHPKYANVAMEAEDVFEVVDKESNLVLDFLAAERANEDLMYALDKAVEQGVMDFQLYIKQVRMLAREQFSYRAMLVKLKGPSILHWPY